MNQKISVIIPTLNGEQTLTEFFTALKMQDLQPDEILVGDSQSRDNTVEICKGYGAKVLTIERSNFDHGGTRSYLAQKAEGTILVFFTQDAILSSPDALRRIVESLSEGSKVICAYGRQLPQHNATLLSAHLRNFNYPPVSKVKSFDDRLTEGLKTIFISNSFAAYVKEPLSLCGYFKNGLIFGEDTCTLGRLLKAGYKVSYTADAGVYHSHNYTITDEFKRSFDIGVLHSSETWLLETYGTAEGIGTKYVRSALSAIVEKKRYGLIFDWLLRSGSKFIGYKLGRCYLSLPRRMRPYLSLHSFWWNNLPDKVV